MKAKNKTLGLLKMELDLFKRCIEEVEKSDFEEYQCQSHSVGELKHRAIALKRTLTKINKLSTSDFRN